MSNYHYQEYLKSTGWQKIKIEFNSLYSGKPEDCFLCCRTTEALHHWNYPSNLKDDCWKNLLPVCHECHTAIHEGFHNYAIVYFDNKVDYMLECLSWYTNGGNRYYQRGYDQGYKDAKNGLSNNRGARRG